MINNAGPATFDTITVRKPNKIDFYRFHLEIRFNESRQKLRNSSKQNENHQNVSLATLSAYFLAFRRQYPHSILIHNNLVFP